MLSEAQAEQFFAEGWTVVPDLFTEDDLAPLIAEIEALIDGVAQRLHAAGRLAERHADAPFTHRLTRLLTEAPECAGEFFGAIEGKGGGGHTGQGIYSLLTHPRLLDAMERLVGPEIVASSVYRIRPKVPGLARGVVPWHQDSGYIAAHCDDALIVTCWIPLVDATVENGCLWVIPRAHRADCGGGSVVRHHTGGNAGFLVILEDDLPQTAAAIPVPVPRGGALLMTNLTPHCSTENATEAIRWSIDLRYQSRAVPNNLSAPLEALRPDDPAVTMACYPPEGDFVVRSRHAPESVSDLADFVRRRTAFERATLPGPRRGWSPAPEA